MGFKKVVNIRGLDSQVGSYRFQNRRHTPYLSLVIVGICLSFSTVTGCTGSGGGGGGQATGGSGTTRSATRTPLNLPPIEAINDADGFFSTAEKTADLVTQPLDRASTLASIAKARQKSGDAAGAKQTLAQLTNYAATLPATGDQTKSILPFIAETQAALGDIDGAMKTAGSIKDAEAQSDAWSRVIAGQAQSGDVNGAIKNVAKAKFIDATHQYAALTAIATEAVDRGDPQGAKTVAKFVEAHWLPKVYSDVADSLHRHGNTSAAQGVLQTAISSVNNIHDKKNISYENANKAEALMSISQVQLGWGDKAGATKTLQSAYQLAGKVGVDSSMSWDLHNDLIGHLVSNLLLVGDLKTAQAAASSIKDPAMRDSYLASVKNGKPIMTPDMENVTSQPKESPIIAQARQGDLAGAKKGLSEVLEPSQRAYLLAQVGAAIRSGKESTGGK